MPQLFSRTADMWLRLGLLLAVAIPVVGALMGLAWARSSYITGQSRFVVQPVPFSHQHHVGDVGIDCRFCHTTVERSATAGMPITEVCIRCHRHLWNEAPVLAPVFASFQSGEPLRWNRVHDLPDFVYFNHAIHIHKGIACVSCHGRIDQMPLTRQDAPLTMKWCLDCHRSPEQHVRPRSLVFDPLPLDQLTDREPLRQWIEEPSAQLTLSELRHRLASEYDVQRLTDCYTCHR